MADRGRTTTAMKVLGYVRVSTEEQAEIGVSLEAQQAKLTAYASLYDLELVEVVVDAGVSAKSFHRPGLQRALSLLQKGKAQGLLAACRREKAMAHYKALRLVRRRPFAQKNHRSVSESVLGREAFLPVWSLSTQAYALPRPA